MYEIEIKSLLGSRERADELKRQLVRLFPKLKILPPHKQRNFYFNTPKDLSVLEKAVIPLLSHKKQEELKNIAQKAKSGISIRTRDADGKALFIIKASIGDDSSSNGVSRVEFEEPVALSFDALNQKLIDAGLSFEAKWSREREEYMVGEIHITIDKNAGYGYLAEFERMVEDEGAAEKAQTEVKALMKKVDCEELPQDRLERMFKFYNEHWEEYYVTDNVFTVE